MNRPSHSFRRRATLAGFASLAAAPLLAQAQSWSAKPVKLIVGYPPAGAADALARLLAEHLSPVLGQTVVVDNRAGASGTIGMDAVAKAAPDGHTLGFSAISPLVLSPHLGRLPYQVADIAPVVGVVASPVLLLATPAMSARDFAALLAEARARPGALRWATSGPASLGHLVLEHVKAGAGVDITHIPYKGGGQQISDALSGQFEVLSVNAGKLRPLAVGAPTRLDALPAVPTLAERGLPAANLASVFGVFAPAGTPLAVQQRVNAEVNRLLQAPDVRKSIAAADNLPIGGSAADFARLIAAESASKVRVIQAAGIKTG